MSTIQLLPEKDIAAYTDIVINAYPGIKITTGEARQKLIDRLIDVQENIPVHHLYGLYRDGELLGGIRLFDFRMNVLGVEMAAGGLGMVAVDLLHKKEHVAKEMLTFFVRHYREQGTKLALLYPFRPDFYYAMHFGYGPKLNRYRFRPAALRKGSTKAHVRYLTEADKSALMDCYNRYQASTHGMIVRYPPEWDGWFNNLGLENRLVGCVREGRVEGYILFGFKARPVESPLRNDMIIKEFVYTGREALDELLTFLRSQADQIDRIAMTTYDDTFHHLLLDPRDECEDLIPPTYHESNVQGVGLMYRVLDVPGILHELAGRDFNGQSCRLKLTVSDSFLPENEGSTRINFDHGKLQTPHGDGACDVEIRLNVAEFSSLLVGAVGFRALVNYGLAEISDEGWLETVDRLFAVAQKPVCLTAF